MNDRKDLSQQLDIIGQIFEIDEIVPLLHKYEKGISTVKFNAITIQIVGKLVSKNKLLADRLVAMHNGTTLEEVDAMDDGAYSKALRDAITVDVLGFFA